MLPTPNNYRRILVIDDNPSIHSDFEKILRPGYESQDVNAIAAFLNEAELSIPIRNFEIDYATQGEEGYQKVRQSIVDGCPYGLVFVDMRMPPGWDGLHTIEHLLQADPKLQTVLCTAYSDYSWSEMVQRIGDTDRVLVLKKPFENIEVRQTAMALCEKRALLELAGERTKQLECLVDERTRVLTQWVTTDTLTQLANRSVFQSTLEECIQSRRNSPGACDAVLYIDLDNFKIVNDSMGHQAGDELLIEVASRLLKCVRGDDQVYRSEGNLPARFGGDEFAVLLRNLRSPDDVEPVCQRLIKATAQPIRIGKRDLSIGASIGVAIIDDSTESAEDILRNADTAMYAAKHAGRNCSLVFDSHMHEDVMQRLDAESDIRSALINNRFEVHYQPIVSLTSLKATGYEALIRMRSDDGQLIRPDQFIPTAEETGLIVPIGQLVLDDACKMIRSNQQQAADVDVSISVNVSKRQLMQTDFVDSVRDTLERHEISAHGVLNLEVTESMIMDDVEQYAQSLHQLRELGIKIHLDDFGTGYSSLACLHQFPIDVLKIDRSFISGETSHETGIVEAILAIATALKIQVVAEGIETTAQLEWLRQLKCVLGQGFLFGKPQLMDQLHSSTLTAQIDLPELDCAAH